MRLRVLPCVAAQSSGDSGVMQGSAAVDQGTVVSTDAPQQGQPFCFMVIARNNTVRLAADTDEMRQQWIDTIKQSQLALPMPPSPPKPPRQ